MHSLRIKFKDASETGIHEQISGASKSEFSKIRIR